MARDRGASSDACGRWLPRARGKRAFPPPGVRRAVGGPGNGGQFAVAVADDERRLLDVAEAELVLAQEVLEDCARRRVEGDFVCGTDEEKDDQQRRLFLGVSLPDFLRQADAVTGAHFLDAHGRQVPLVWLPRRRYRLLMALGATYPVDVREGARVSDSEKAPRRDRGTALQRQRAVIAGLLKAFDGVPLDELEASVAAMLRAMRAQ